MYIIIHEDGGLQYTKDITRDMFDWWDRDLVRFIDISKGVPLECTDMCNWVELEEV